MAPECKKVEVPAGKGDADFPRLIEILREIGYDGYITIERENYDDPNHEREIDEIKVYLESLIS